MKTCPKCSIRYPNTGKFCFVDGADLVALRDPRIGTLLAGRYVIEDVIGEGGMATVYRARHKLIDRPCAIKILNAALATDNVVRERFRREAKSAKKLSHPNIIEIYDQGETEDHTAYMVMEILEGSVLSDLVGAQSTGQPQTIGIARAVGLMIQLARGIARAHDFEVIHRDLKPENVFVCAREDGTDLVKLLDFGIARSRTDSRLTGVGELFGTPQYMAPERITSGEAGPSIDLYALGVMFYEMVTGTLPFEAPDVPTFLIKHLKEAPRPPRLRNPEIPAALDDLILRLMAKEAKARPVDAHRVHQDLRAIARALGAPIPPEPEVDPASSRPHAMSLPAVGIDAWGRRAAILQAMLDHAFAGAAPEGLKRGLEAVRAHVRRLTELRSKSMTVQRSLEEIELRGRDGRQRFGFAVDALGIDASKAKDEVRAAGGRAKELALRVAEAIERFVASHKDVTFWEGRSAFHEPYADLAKAYRDAANHVDAWLALREKERSALAACETFDRAVSDLEFQIRELRAALATHEGDIEAEQRKGEQLVTEMGREAETLEGELVAMTAELCEPLRRRSELATLFRELEAESPATR